MHTSAREDLEKQSPTRDTRMGLLAILGAVVFTLALTSCGKNSSAKFKQYYVHGEQLYEKHCRNCHQADGSGLRRVYPPLNTSDYMKNNFDNVVCLIRYGKSGEIFVNGQEFNQPMHGVTGLTDIEIAEITTYIYNTWSHERGLLEVKDATAILAACKDRGEK